MQQIPQELDIKVHRFLDEAGDTTFYGKHKLDIIGTNGVSKCFILGMLKINEPLEPLRERIIALQQQITTESNYISIPSIHKKIRGKGFYFHATDDIPEVRQIFFNFIQQVDCRFEAIVGRKIPRIYELKHNNKEAEFYADLLSHLLKNKLGKNQTMVLNIAERANSTKHHNLMLALNKAKDRFQRNNGDKLVQTNIAFNVQNHLTEPLLNIVDYLCWAIQRVFELGEMKYYEQLLDKMALIVDLYDSSKYKDSKNYYRDNNLLTEVNKIIVLRGNLEL